MAGSKENAERAVVEVVYKPPSGLQSRADKVTEASVKGAVEAVSERGSPKSIST